MAAKATNRGDFEHCENPGDFFITPPNDVGERRLSFLCPCGCGMLAGIKIRDDGQQSGGAWSWNFDKAAPTCAPSILINQGHWHGYLTNGEFVSC